MDVVYTYRFTGPLDELELKYSLRSVEKHISGINRLFIVGDRPGLTNFDHIYKDDPHINNPARNIYEKILTACRHPDISEDFLCCSNDHFILQDFYADRFPFYYRGQLEQVVIKLSQTQPYRKPVLNTMSALETMGSPTKYYNVHCPIVYTKRQYIRVMEQFDWSIFGGYISKSLYSNTISIPGTSIEKDIKCYFSLSRASILRKIQQAPFFSTNEYSMNQEMIQILEELFPDKSRWELS